MLEARKYERCNIRIYSDLLKSRLVSCCIASLVSVGRLLGHLLIYLLSDLFHFCFSFYNQFLLCVSCCLLACVFDNVIILPFDLSILILDQLCMNLLCLYRYFL